MGTEDWPVHGHDPGHTGANPNGTGPSETLEGRWNHEPMGGAGAVTGQPVVAGDVVYGGTAGSSERDPVAFAVRADGTSIWNTTLETTGDLFAQNPQVTAAPAVTSDAVYVAGTEQDGFVFALDRSTGVQQWDQYVGGNATAAPIVVNDVVYVGSARASGTMEGTAGPLTAVNASDGSTVWRADLDGTEVVGSPAYHEGTVYAGTTGGGVYAVDAASGNVSDDNTGVDGVTTATTVVDGAVYVGTATGTVHRLSTGGLDSVENHLLTTDGRVAGLAVHDGTVYATTTNDSVYALDAGTLEETNRVRFEGPLEDAPTVVDETLYVRAGGTVHTFDLALDKRDEVAAYEPTSGVVGSNGQAYVGTMGGVGAIDQICEASVTGEDGDANVSVPTDCRSLAGAVEAADHGETVFLEAGTYDGPGNASVTVRKNLTVKGPAATLSGTLNTDNIAFNGLRLTDGTTLEGVTFTEYNGSAVWIWNASDVTVADVQVSDLGTGSATRGVRVETVGGGTAGDVLIDGLTVDSATTVSEGVLVRAHDGAGEPATISNVTVRNVDVGNATVGVNVTASDGAAVDRVTVERSKIAADFYGLRTTAGPNATVAGLTVRNLTVPNEDVATGVGIEALTGSSATADATARNVTLSDTAITGGAYGVEIDATTDGTADALVADVTAENLSAADAAGAAVSVEARNESATETNDGAVVRDVTVTGSLLDGSDTGLAVRTENATHGAVTVTDSNVTANDDGVVVAPGTNATGVAVTGGTIADNVKFGAANNGSGTLDVTENWWGTETGPNDTFRGDGNCNENGTGDAVTASVTYEPWVSPPTANATANETTVNISEVVAFEGSATTESGEIVAYEWSFGDNTSASGQTVNHAYDVGGTFEVRLTVEDSLGDTDTDTVTVDVRDRVPPVVVLEAPDYVQTGTNVTFDASESSDDGEIAEYRWDFDGDGTNDTTTAGPTLNHSYATDGEYAAQVTAVDTVGNENATTRTVTADGTPPAADLGANRTEVEVGDTVAFDATNSTDAPAGVDHYEWDLDGDGTVEATTSTGTAAHTYEVLGEFDATVTVVDNAGNRNATNVTVRVVDSTPPVADADAPRYVQTGTAATFDGSDSSDNHEVAEYRWDFDDDGTNEVETSDPTTDYAYESDGEYTVRLTVTDAAGNENATTASVTADGTPPAAALSANETDVNVSEPVAFDANESADALAGIDRYEWDLDGDGSAETTTTDATATHAYETAGEFDATVTVVDNAGNRNATNVTVAVTDSTAPDAAFDVSPSSPAVGETATFDAENSTDNDQIDYYAWDFDGDGAVDVNSSDATVDHAYDAKGTYEVELTVGDAAGNADSTSETVEVTESTDDGSDGSNDGSDGGEDTTDGTNGGTTSPPPTGGSDGGETSPSPDISGVDASVGATEVEVGDSVTVTATFENTGTAEGSETVDLTVDGETRESREITVAADESVTVTFTVSFDEAGDYAVAVGGLSAGTVGVTDPSNVADRTDAEIDDGTATFDDSTLESVTFTAGGSGTISTTRLSELPDHVTTPNGTMLLPMRIEVPPEMADQTATVRFSIAESRLEAANAAAEDVQLIRWHDGEWQRLDTRVVDDSGEAVRFGADTPGFSLFAAYAPAEEQATETATVTPTPTEPPTATPTDTPGPTATPVPSESATPATEPPANPSGAGLGNVLLLVGLLGAVVVGGLVAYRRYADEEDAEPRIRT
jgi:PGF-pre-PGF domain-containing protein